MTMRIAFRMAAAASVCVTAAAQGQIDPNTTMFTTGGLIVVSPLDGQREAMGPMGPEVVLAAPAGTFALAEQVDIDVVVFIHDANGVNQAISVFEGVNGGARTTDGAGGVQFEVDPSTPPLGSALRTAINTARAFVGIIQVSGGGLATGAGIGIVANDQSQNGAETLLDVHDEATDMIFEPDLEGPQLVRVVRDQRTSPERFVFEFDDVIAPSMLAGIENDDFELSTTMNGQFAALAAIAFPGNAAISTSNDHRSIVMDVAMGQENLAPAIGSYVRVALPDNGGTTNDALLDFALNPADEQEPVIVESATLADLSGDNMVSGLDLGMLLAQWGPCPGGGACSADLNNDGAVDAQDLGLLLTSWTN
jgi:hypothetical protein